MILRRRRRRTPAEDHTPERIRERLDAPGSGRYLGDFIYGAIDGVVTTFAIVAGVAGADMAVTVVAVLGIANLVADGLSMAASNYLGTRADAELQTRIRRSESAQIDAFPAGEREEVRQIYRRKGLDGEVLDGVVEAITADRERWIDTMIVEEFGLSKETRSPLLAGGATFGAFLVVGAVPLLPFVVGPAIGLAPERPFLWSLVMTSAAFVLVGAAKAAVVQTSWWRSSAETLAIGGGAAMAAYLLGDVLGRLL